MPDLWPDDIGAVEVIAPVTILKEQASLLGEKTRNVIRANVREARSAVPMPGFFIYAFYITAPSLDHYRYELFRIRHRIDLYPVEFVLQDDLLALFPRPEEGRDFIEASNEGEMIEFLTTIFGSEKTRTVIGSLLAQSEGYEPTPDNPF